MPFRSGKLRVDSEVLIPEQFAAATISSGRLCGRLCGDASDELTDTSEVIDLSLLAQDLAVEPI